MQVTCVSHLKFLVNNPEILNAISNKFDFCRDFNLFCMSWLQYIPENPLSTYYLDIGQIDLCILKEQDKLAYMFYKASHKK